MNDQKISSILIEVLENVCNKFPETRDYIDKNIQEICSRENLVYNDQVFYFFSSLYLIMAGFIFDTI